MKVINETKALLKNKKFLYSVILAGIMAYGYEIIHGVIGVDDICIGKYFGEEGLGLTIGRWPFYLLNKIGVLGLDTYVPWIVDLTAVMILIMAACVWTATIKTALQKYDVEMPILSYIVFAVICISYSLTGHVFVYYLHNGVAIGYLLTGIATFLYVDRQCCKNTKINIIEIIILLTCACGFYESFLAVGLMGIIACLMLEEIFEQKTMKQRCREIGYVLVIFIVVILARSLICKVLSICFGVSVAKRSVSAIGWIFQKGGIVKLIKICYWTLIHYFLDIAKNYVQLIDVASIAIIAIICYEIKRRKRALIAIYGIALFVSVFIMSLFLGNELYFLPYRAAQGLPIFVGGGFACVICWIQRRKQKVRWVGNLLITVLIWNNLCSINYLFYSEKIRNETYMSYIANIGEDIEKVAGRNGGDKPVVFIGKFEEMSFEDERYLAPMVGKNIIDWGVSAFDSPIYQFFMLRGYNFQHCTEEQEVEATSMFTNIPEYPMEGYLKTTDEYIVVNLGSKEGK